MQCTMYMCQWLSFHQVYSEGYKFREMPMAIFSYIHHGYSFCMKREVPLFNTHAYIFAVEIFFPRKLLNNSIVELLSLLIIMCMYTSTLRVYRMCVRACLLSLNCMCVNWYPYVTSCSTGQ